MGWSNVTATNPIPVETVEQYARHLGMDPSAIDP